jgi:pimeloyl-ACP methyl ester carboxylesterase
MSNKDAPRPAKSSSVWHDGIHDRRMAAHPTQEIDMDASRTSRSNSQVTYQQAPTRTVSVHGIGFVYRHLGPDGGVPIVLLNHLAAVLDNWDPRVVDGLAAQRRVITFDNRGVGASGGSTPDTIEAMADDAVAFVRALGFDQVDLLGFSIGGFIAQVIAQQEPQLIRKIILAGTGPAAGEGIDKVTTLTLLDIARGALTFQDAKQFLFFTRTAGGRQAGRECGIVPPPWPSATISSMAARPCG